MMFIPGITFNPLLLNRSVVQGDCEIRLSLMLREICFFEEAPLSRQSVCEFLYDSVVAEVIVEGERRPSFLFSSTCGVYFIPESLRARLEEGEVKAGDEECFIELGSIGLSDWAENTPDNYAFFIPEYTLLGIFTEAERDVPSSGSYLSSRWSKEHWNAMYVSELSRQHGSLIGYEQALVARFVATGIDRTLALQYK